ERRSADDKTGVAPGIEAARADPHPSDAQTRDEADDAVHGNHLAVVSTDPAERTIESRRVVAADLDTCAPQSIPEAARRLAEPAHPVVQQPHLHAFGGLADQRVGEPPALIVLVNDVHLEVNRALRAGDRFEPGGIVLFGVPQDLDAVAVAERRAGRARERLVRELPEEQRRVLLIGSHALLRRSKPTAFLASPAQSTVLATTVHTSQSIPVRLLVENARRRN